MAPFSVPAAFVDKPVYFTAMEKVSVFAFSFLVGSFMGKIPAISSFYVVTAYMKEKKINSAQSCLDVKAQEVWSASPISSTQIGEQVASESFTAAVALLACDLKKEVSFTFSEKSRERNLEEMKKGLLEAGLNPIVTKLGATPNKYALLAGLRHLTQRFGSAVVPATFHKVKRAVIVDKVSEDLQQVILRDPYDGLVLTVTGKAFIKQFKGGEILQIEGPKRFS